MKQKHLIWRLEQVPHFKQPKLSLEQYETSAEMAAEIVQAVKSDFSDRFDECLVADLGCGPGILLTAFALMGAKRCQGFELDEDVFQTCRESLEQLRGDLDEDQEVDVVQCDVLSVPTPTVFYDIVVTNPPFGTKNNEGVDLQFVQAGLRLMKQNGAVYSLHKSTTRDGVIRHLTKANPNLVVEAIAEMNWLLPATYKFHKKGSVNIRVDLIRSKWKS